MESTGTKRHGGYRVSFGGRVFDAVNILLLLVFIVIVFYPFYFCVMLSFNDGRDADRGGIYFWPRVFSIENYKIVFSDARLLIAARNTVLRTLLGTVITVFFTSMFAFAASRPHLAFKKLYLTLGFITLYFNGGLIPTYLLIRSLGLLDRFLVYLVPSLFSMFNAIIFMSFFKTLPPGLIDAALIDGASDFHVFLRIAIPVSTPVLAAVALFTGVGQWNSWFDTMLYTRSAQLDTLPHILMKMIQTQRYFEMMADSATASTNMMLQMQGLTSTSLQLATMVITAFPIIAAYPFLQKYFVKGIMIGSIKG